jgi:hypothetical protein
MAVSNAPGRTMWSNLTRRKPERAPVRNDLTVSTCPFTVVPCARAAWPSTYRARANVALNGSPDFAVLESSLFTSTRSMAVPFGMVTPDAAARAARSVSPVARDTMAARLIDDFMYASYDDAS